MKLVLIDLFGVFCSNSYTPWVVSGASSNNIKQFVKTHRKDGTLPYAESCDLSDSETDYFFKLMELNDKEGKISDAELYNVLSEASKEPEESIRKMIHSEVINSDIVSVINILRNKPDIIVALASSSGKEIVTEMVEKSSVVFDKVFYQVNKTSCDWYINLAQDFDISLQEIYLIDDNIDNITAAENCNIHAIHYDANLSSKEILEDIIPLNDF